MRNERQPLALLASFLMPIAVTSACNEGGIAFISGSGRLPDCDDPPAALDAQWFDQGTVNVTSAGCADAQAGDEFTVCTLNWVFTQDGNSIDIVVDNEYRIKGRLCGTQLHLEGGWWLPVQDENNQCNYDDDGDEVVIQSGGNTLSLTEETVDAQTQRSLVGTLSLSGQCTATYDITLTPSG